MKRRLSILVVVFVIALVAVVPVSANRGDGALGVIYVSSQGLYYDTFVTAETLPMKERFQAIINNGESKVQTSMQSVFTNADRMDVYPDV